jgi:hypothetical protein
MRKKEDSEKVAKRVKRYYQNPDHKRLEIIGITSEEKDSFINLKGLENLTSANKLRILMKIWDKHSEDFSDYVLEHHNKENSISGSEFFNTCQIYDKELIEFVEKNKISPALLANKLNLLKETSIKICLQTPYLFYLKNIFETNKKSPLVFSEMLLNKDFIETFLQKVEAEKRSTEEEKKLKDEYINKELEKARRFLFGKNELYFELINKNKNKSKCKLLSSGGSSNQVEKMALNLLASTINPENLVGNRAVIRDLLPDIQSLPNYPFVSFEKWKKSLKH